MVELEKLNPELINEFSNIFFDERWREAICHLNSLNMSKFEREKCREKTIVQYLNKYSNGKTAAFLNRDIFTSNYTDLIQGDFTIIIRRLATSLDLKTTEEPSFSGPTISVKSVDSFVDSGIYVTLNYDSTTMRLIPKKVILSMIEDGLEPHNGYFRSIDYLKYLPKYIEEGYAYEFKIER